MRQAYPWRFCAGAVFVAVVAAGCWSAPLCIAQTVVGPSNSHPSEPFHLRDDARHAKRWQEGEVLWKDVARRLADVDGKISDGKIRALKFRDIGTIRAKQRMLMKIGRELESMGETAGVELQMRALWADERMRRIKDELGNVPALRRKRESEKKLLRTKAARYEKTLDDIRGHIKRGSWGWQKADKAMQKMTFDLESRAVWIDGADRKRILGKFDSVRRTIAVGLHSDLRRYVARSLGDQFKADAPNLDKFGRLIHQSIRSIQVEGHVELTPGQTVDGPQLIGKINDLWRRMQVATLRLKALNWVRARSDSKANGAQTVLEKQYEKFDLTARSAIATLIESDAARANADEAVLLYPRYLQAVAPLLARSADSITWSRSVSKALDALLAKSPPLAQDVAAYRLATDDVLRWRRRAAADRAMHRQAAAPALDRLTQTAFLPDEPRDSLGLIVQAGMLPLLRGRSEETVRAISERMIDQAVHRGSMIGADVEKTRRYFSWLEGRTLSQVTSRIETSSAVARLKRDLLIDDDAMPLSLEAAVALFKAERGDLTALGGRIEGIELLSLVNYAAATKPEPPFLLRLGQLPREVSDSGRPMHALIVRFSLIPVWVQNDYFFVEIADIPKEKK